MIFVGNDWAQDHHDVWIMDRDGDKLASRRLPEGDGVWPGCMSWWLVSLMIPAR